MNTLRIKIIASLLLSLLFSSLLSQTIFLNPMIPSVKTLPDQIKTYFGYTPKMLYFSNLRFFTRNIIPTPTVILPTQTPNVFPSVSPINPTTSTSKPTPKSAPSSKPTPTYAKLKSSPTPAPFHYPPTATPLPKATLVPPSPHSTKLGIFILSDYSSGARKIVNSHPTVIKVMDPQSIPSLLEAARTYKQQFPQGVVLLRIYNGDKRYTLSDNPTSAADNYFNSVIKPALDRLGDNRRYFDFNETPNELDNTPGWDNLDNVRWLSTFWSTLIDLNSANGMKTCIGSIPVGNPPGEENEIRDKISAFLPALQKAKNTGGAFCYHAYTIQYSTDTNTEKWYSLRYRMLHNLMSQMDGNLSQLPFILSEAGVDQNGNPAGSGWQARGSADDYKRWLQWFGGQIQQDNYVIGATLFQIGDGHWSSFNLEPIADWLSSYSTQ